MLQSSNVAASKRLASASPRIQINSATIATLGSNLNVRKSPEHNELRKDLMRLTHHVMSEILNVLNSSQGNYSIICGCIAIGHHSRQ